MRPLPYGFIISERFFLMKNVADRLENDSSSTLELSPCIRHKKLSESPKRGAYAFSKTDSPIHNAKEYELSFNKYFSTSLGKVYSKRKEEIRGCHSYLNCTT